MPARHKASFATAPVTKGTLLWQPKEVKAVPADEITSILAAMPHDKATVRANVWFISPNLPARSQQCILFLQELLRQSFVAPSDSGALCINPSDNGRFTNHSCTPNVGA